MNRDLEQLPSLWKSERLTIRDALENDLPELRKIYEECSYIEKLIGYSGDEADPILASFRGEALPPHGKKELQRMQTILESKSENIVGYFELYHGYPDDETFWIAQLSIRPTFQRQKFGREVLLSLIEHVKALGKYSKMGIGVGVGNEPALKFWESCGFTEIINTVQHETHADEWRVKKLDVGDGGSGGI